MKYDKRGVELPDEVVEMDWAAGMMEYTALVWGVEKKKGDKEDWTKTLSKFGDEAESLDPMSRF